MDKNKLQKDFKETVQNLKIAVDSFDSGKRSMYRVIATQLRLLMCDGNNSLLKKLCNNIEFEPLKKKSSSSLHIGGSLKFDGKGGVDLDGIFDIGAKPIPLSKWLKQDIANSGIEVFDLIKSVADKEAVHADDNYNDTIIKGKSILLAKNDFYVQYIHSIGRYVLTVLQNTLDNDNKRNSI